MTHLFLRPNPLKAVASTKDILCDNTHSPPTRPPFMDGGGWNKIRSKNMCISTFRAGQRRMRSGDVHFGRTATWKDQRLVRETRSVWAGSAHKPGRGGGPRGGGGGGRRNSEFPSYCARKLAGHMREILLSGPGSAGCLVSRSIFHQLFDLPCPYFTMAFDHRPSPPGNSVWKYWLAWFSFLAPALAVRPSRSLFWRLSHFS